MSIDIDVVCLRRPDLQTCEEFALFIASPMLGRSQFADVFVMEHTAGFGDDGPDATHPIAGGFWVSLVAHVRDAPTFLAQLVLASAISVLYHGYIEDRSPSFPSLDPTDVLRRCVDARLGQADMARAQLTGT